MDNVALHKVIGIREAVEAPFVTLKSLLRKARSDD